MFFTKKVTVQKKKKKKRKERVLAYIFSIIILAFLELFYFQIRNFVHFFLFFFPYSITRIVPS